MTRRSGPRSSGSSPPTSGPATSSRHRPSPPRAPGTMPTRAGSGDSSDPIGWSAKSAGEGWAPFTSPSARTASTSNRSRSRSSSAAWTPSRCSPASGPSGRSSPRSTIPTSRACSTAAARTEGVPFFVMEYIEGEPIDAYGDAPRALASRRLRLFLQVCAAVAYAHQNLVVHRDIKPLNILVTADGVPKLLDFGIAKLLHDDADEATSTVTGMRPLTPEYASPEQIEGDTLRPERRLRARRRALRAADRPVTVSHAKPRAARSAGGRPHHRSRATFRGRRNPEAPPPPAGRPRYHPAHGAPQGPPAATSRSSSSRVTCGGISTGSRCGPAPTRSATGLASSCGGTGCRSRPARC